MPSVYPDPAFGQPYQMIFVAEHIRAAALHHENVVLYKSPIPLTDGRALKVSREVEHGITTIRLHTRRGNEWLNRGLVYWGIGTQVLGLLVAGFRPDLIHVHIFSEARIALGLARLLRVPLVVTEHWTALCREGELSPARLKFARQVYERSEGVLVVCDHLRGCIEANTGANIKSRVIFNAVDTSVFFDDGRPREKNILTVARLEPAKDIPTLLRAVSMLKDKNIGLKIVGRGDAGQFTELIRELGISDRVEFLGEQSKQKIAELMRTSTVFALASLWENSPCVIGEALCCGLPVVATRVGGVPELVDQSQGRLVDAGDSQALADGLEEILQHPDQFDRRGIEAAARVRFGYESIGAQLDEVYREVAHAD